MLDFIDEYFLDLVIKILLQIIKSASGLVQSIIEKFIQPRAAYLRVRTNLKFPGALVFSFFFLNLLERKR